MDNSQISINGRTFELVVERNRGSYATARVKDSTIVIRIPRHVRDAEAYKVFVGLKNRMVRRLEKSQPEKPRFLEFTDGQSLTIIGNPITVKIIPTPNDRTTAKLEDRVMQIKVPLSLSGPERTVALHDAARRAILRHSMPMLERRVSDLNAQHFGFAFNTLHIRDQMTRWGSYSWKTRNMQLNYRLLFAPAEVLDSVIVHELAHIRHRNHSKRFWDAVLGAMPDYKERRKWLNKNGNGLGIQDTKAQILAHADGSITPSAPPGEKIG